MDEKSAVLLDAPPAGEAPTDYDWQHRICYLRLLDADAEGAGWQEVARAVLKLDPSSNPAHVRAVWQSHLDRARWMANSGYRAYLDD